MFSIVNWLVFLWGCNNMEVFIAICRVLKRRVVSKWAKENNLFTTFKKKSGEIMMSNIFPGLMFCKIFLVPIT